MTQTILNGGSRTSQDLFTGEPREITFDDSNQELRLHDGATAGGRRVPNIDTNNLLYQAKNPELNGFSFDPNVKGFPVRVAAGQYVIRSIEFTDELTVLNPSGLMGNPTFGLADELPGDRIIGGDFLVRGVATILGGLNADVDGAHTGSSTGTHTGPQVGAVDVRGAVLQLDDNQIAQSKINGLAAALAAVLEPIGTIKMWGASVASIPSGWVICDGDNGTPDLVGRFIVGADASTQDDAGGSSTHTHVVTAAAGGTHQHSVTVAGTALDLTQIPSHSHKNGVADVNDKLFPYGGAPVVPSTTDTIDQNSQDGTRQGITEAVGGGQPHTHSASSTDAGNHTHAITADAANNLPPFYSILFIMKIS